MNAPTVTVAGRRSAWSGTVAALLFAAALAALWAVVYPRVPDMAAQVYRVDLFGRVGFAVWDSRWYGGYEVPGYSLISPALGALIGLRAMGALAALASTILFARLTRILYGDRAAWSACLFAVGAVGDVWSGRVTFALGVSFGLAAVLALLEGRRWATLLLAALCAASSPVTGALLAMTGVSLALGRRSPRKAGPWLLGVLAVLVPVELLFGEGGVEPYPLHSFVVTALVTIGFVWAVGRGQRLLRIGGLVYLCAVLLSLLVSSPMGSNAERYGVLLAGPLLLALLCSDARPSSRAGRALAVVVACGASLWVIWGPVRETRAVAGDPSTGAAYYEPVRHFLASHGGDLVRIEVPFTRSHWEAALLAPTVSLARGWEKQLDTRYDDVLLQPGLTPSRYHAWLRQEAVSFVALPDVRPDPSSAQESRLIRSGLSYLRLVFASAHWKIYEVLGSSPLVSGRGRLEHLGHDSFTVQASRRGRLLVRLHYTRYWTITAGSGCVRPGRGGWTQVQASRSGRITVAARFSVARALGLGGSCRSAG